MRLFSSLELVVAPPAREPGQDTAANYVPRLHHLAPGQLPIVSERSPGATGLASSLSGCFRSQAGGAFFTSPVFGRFSRILPRPRVLPGVNAHFVPPFGVFRLADSLAGTARVIRPC